jgi:putative hemolysin
MSEALRLLLVLALVLGNGLFVAAEYALVTARRSRLEERANAGSHPARVALRLMDDPVNFISTVQVGITIFAILTGAIGEPLLSQYFEEVMPDELAFLLSFLILTYLSVVVGELVPKALALARADPLAAILSVPIELLGRVFWPVTWVLQRSAGAIARVFGVDPTPAGVVSYTREDILHSVAAAEDFGAIEQAEEEMLYNVFDFASKEVHEVMVPRPEVVAIAVDMPPEEALAAVLDSPYTRYPAYRGSLDHILGVLHVRDLFSALHDRGIAQVRIEDLLRPAHVVPETKDLAALLADFRRERHHLAVVVDEYGATQGLVTLEDVLEELVGEIEDEFDLPDESVERIDDRTIRIDGTFPIDDFNEQFGTELPAEDYHTVAGFVFGQLGHAPSEGDEVEYAHLRFRVLDVEGTRIQRLEVVFEETRPPVLEEQAPAA